MAKKRTGNKRYTANKNAGTQKSKRDKIKRTLFAALVFVIVAAVIFFLVLRSGDSISISENALGSLITPVQKALTTVTGKVQDFVGSWRDYDKLQDEYDQLEIQYEQARMELVSAEEALLENDRLKTQLGAKDTYAALDPIYAKVIARDAGPWFETFSINRGTNSGVAVGMAIVNGDGLIGRVYEVGLNYAKVICIIDSRSAVACLVQRTRDNGVMRGQISASDSHAECFVYYLPNINSITPGDTVVTSGTDSLYPKGLKIGTVTALSLDAGSDGTYAIISPSVDFQRIEEVFVLRTVIETDTDILPTLEQATPEPYRQSATPKPGATAIPEAGETEEVWVRTTPAPDGIGASYSDFKVNDLIEDSWAAN